MAASGGEDIKAELASLDAGVRDVRTKLALESIKRDERIAKSEKAIKDAHGSARRATRVAIFAVVVGVIGIFVAVMSIRQVHDANANRAQRTVAACLQANEQTGRSIKAAEATSDDFIDYLGAAGKKNPSTDPVKLRAFVVGAKAAQHRVIERYNPRRDCSPRGLAAYYAPKNP